MLVSRILIISFLCQYEFNFFLFFRSEIFNSFLEHCYIKKKNFSYLNKVYNKKKESDWSSFIIKEFNCFGLEIIFQSYSRTYYDMIITVFWGIEMDKMSTQKKKIRAKTRENIQTPVTVTWSLSPAKQQLFMVQELKYPVWSNSHRGLLLWMLYRIGGSLRRRARIWSPERFIRTLLALCWATLVPYLNKQL